MRTFTKNIKPNDTEEEGFTLIELLVVIVIIGILAAIALPIYLNQQKTAIQAGVKSDLKTAQTQVQTYLTKNPTATHDQIVSDSDVSKFLGAGKMSDVNTRLDFTGDWDTWKLTATNTKAGKDTSTNYTFNYDATSGKYWETGN